MLGIEVSCAKGKERGGFDFSSTRLYLLSPMTATMVKLFSSLCFPTEFDEIVVTEWPNASPLRKKRFEKASFTKTTLGADRVSASVTSRPRRMGMPSVWQKSGPTWFALMPISEKGPWGSTPSMVQTPLLPQPE